MITSIQVSTKEHFRLNKGHVAELHHRLELAAKRLMPNRQSAGNAACKVLETKKAAVKPWWK